jgi:secondary thiamine-phosphate synthase enzyme
MVQQQSIQFRTKGHGDVINLTERIQHVVAHSGVRTGLASVFVIGSTAAVGAMEFEPGLAKDLPEALDRLLPASQDYGHEQAWHDGNGHSHLQATLMGPSLTVPVNSGSLILGTWQQVICIECDTRPRDRTVVVTILGE